LSFLPYFLQYPSVFLSFFNILPSGLTFLPSPCFLPSFLPYADKASNRQN
jgi:hypothetical protein